MISSKITGLEYRAGGRVDVYADGKLLMTVSENAAAEAGLCAGAELDARTVRRLEERTVADEALAKAFRFLDYADMSEKKMYSKLLHAGFSEEVAQSTVERLRDTGYLNDLRYAQRYAENVAQGRLYGPRRITEELYRRGVDGDTARQAVESLDVDFTESVKTLATGRLRRDLTNPAEVKKLIAALMRCGHDYETVKTALSELTDYE